uniref:Cell cycle control protein 50A n=1 Tax=Plectus sambesii TaxID=2011161 RepID=A0A914X8U0_9BILA
MPLSESALHQQKLRAYKPILSITCTLPLFFILGAIFTPAGFLLFKAAQSAQEYNITFTNCNATGNDGLVKAAEDELQKGIFNQSLKCIIAFNLSEDFNGDVNFYYGLENFYQNHRRYVKSRNDIQLAGALESTADCDPYSTTNASGVDLPYAPCGAVANSMYNDTFKLFKTKIADNGLLTESLRVPFTTDGVVWSIETKRKFLNPRSPPGQNKTLCELFSNTVKPPNWQTDVCKLTDGSSFGFESVDFIVWMNVAALPTFRKLYRRLNRTSANFTNGLPKGTYRLEVDYNYPVKAFNGQKRFIITTQQWTGPKNYFLSIAYMTVGVFLLSFSFLLLIIYLKQLREEKNK